MKRFFEEHTDRLFNLSHLAKMRVRVQILLLIFQILKSDTRSKQYDRLMKVIYETLMDPSCLHSSITELFLELVYNALKNDHSLTRVMASIKRLLQNAIHAETNVSIAVLIFLNKLSQNVSGLNQLLKNNFVNDFGDDEEDDENKDLANGGDQKDESDLKDNGGYDYFKRDPLFSKADTSLLWELTCFIEHYHPTVRKIASELLVSLSTNKINYEGNPLLDFTTASFLDRFCMKKPKLSKLESKKKFIEGNKVGRSKMEEAFSIQSVLNDSSNIRDEEKFMFTYFKNKVDSMNYLSKLEKRKENRAKPKVGEGEDEEDKFADELFEKELRKAEVGDRYLGDGSDLEEGEDEEDDEYAELEDEDGEGLAGLDTADFDENLNGDDDAEDDFEDDGVTLKKRESKNRKFKGGKPKKRFIKKR